MHRIGFLGLDTSHPEAFAELLDERDDATVHAVWDDGTVRDDDYVASFCEDYGATRYDDPAAMAAAVDGAMVLAVDWERHVPLATPFLEAGVATFVDKPLAGSVADVDRLADAAAGASLFGGSAVPYHDAFQSLARGGSERTLYGAGYNDYFYYRVHLVDAVRYLADADWRRVAAVDGPGTAVRVRFENGLAATLRFDGSTDDKTFGLLDVGDTTEAVAVESTPDALANMYESLLDDFVGVVDGERDESGRVLDAARLALAVEAALDEGESVRPDGDTLRGIERESEAFVADYEPYY